MLVWPIKCWFPFYVWWKISTHPSSLCKSHVKTKKKKNKQGEKGFPVACLSHLMYQEICFWRQLSGTETAYIHRLSIAK